MISETMEWLKGTRDCPHCGLKIARKAEFCGHCGKAVGRAVPCPSCNAPMNAAARFCGSCGAANDPDKPDALKKAKQLPHKLPTIWSRGSREEFAKLVDVTGDAVFVHGVQVPPGETAVVLVNGRVTGTVSAGSYTPEEVSRASDSAESRNGGVLKRLFSLLRFWASEEAKGQPRTSVQVLVCDTAGRRVSVDSAAKLASTKDGLGLDFEARVILGIADPVRVIGLFKGASTLGEQQVWQELAKVEVEDAIRVAIRMHTAEELRTDAAAGKRLAETVEEDAAERLAEAGLHIKIVSLSIGSRGDAQVIETRSETAAFEELSRALVERAQADTRAWTDLAATARAQDVAEKDDERVGLANEVRHLQARQGIFEQLLEGQNLEEFARLRSQDERDQFVAELSRTQLLREDELRLFKALMDEREDERQQAVAHARALLQATRDRERLVLEQQTAQQLARADDEFGREKAALDARSRAEIGGIDDEAAAASLVRRAAAEAEAARTMGHADLDLAARAAELKRAEDDADFARYMQMQKHHSEDRQEDRKLDLEKSRLQASIAHADIDKDKAIGMAGAEQAAAHAEQLDRLRQDQLHQLRADSQADKDRLERMFSMFSGRAHDEAAKREALVEANAKKIEQMAEHAMDRNADVAGARAGARQGAACKACGALHGGSRFCEGCGALIGAT